MPSVSSSQPGQGPDTLRPQLLLSGRPSSEMPCVRQSVHTTIQAETCLMLMGWAGGQARPSDHPGLGQAGHCRKASHSASVEEPSLCPLPWPEGLSQDSCESCRHSWGWTVPGASQGSAWGWAGHSGWGVLCCKTVGHPGGTDTISRDPVLNIPVTTHLRVHFSHTKTQETVAEEQRALPPSAGVRLWTPGREKTAGGRAHLGTFPLHPQPESGLLTE